jgi:amidophosphoribosyltransferase
MSGEVSHNCGVVVTHSLHDAYSFIGSLQHRGREAAGIAAIGRGDGRSRIDVLKWEGTVDAFDLGSLYRIFPKGEDYHTFMGHVRYATKGGKDRILEDAHPHTIGGEMTDRGSHVIIRGCDMACVHNGHLDDEYVGKYKSDTVTGCDSEAFLHLVRATNPQQVLKKVPGAYTVAIADAERNHVVVLRDRTGIRPGVLGSKDGKYVIASEDIALRMNGATPVEDLVPGAVYFMSPDGDCSRELVVRPNMRRCFFEHNYIAHPDSVIDGVSVRYVREVLGQQLAAEFRPEEDVDFVTFLPSCPENAARHYASRIEAAFREIFYKMRRERAFMGSTPDKRRESIGDNLYLLDDVDLRGQVGVVVDDSTVRGNNAKKECELLTNEAKLEKVYHANYTPPIGIVGEDSVPRGCSFGIDMPPDDDFIARGRTIEEISEEVGMPMIYLSQDGMLKAFGKAGLSRENLCTYCIGGKHPFE